jgi:hypothetical protein
VSIWFAECIRLVTVNDCLSMYTGIRFVRICFVSIRHVSIRFVSIRFVKLPYSVRLYSVQRTGRHRYRYIVKNSAQVVVSFTQIQRLQR